VIVAIAPEIMIRDRWVPEPIQLGLRTWNPKTDLGLAIRQSLKYLPADLAGVIIERMSSVVVFESSLSVIHWRYDPVLGFQVPIDRGMVSRHLVTDTGVAYLVDSWQNILELETMKYHGLGTGTTAESAAQTALVTESTTALNPDSTRATGSLTEGATGNIFRTVGTLTFDTTAAITEHGLFSQAATGGGTMWDRSMFSGSTINVASGDSIQTQYDMTASSGG
jgi:hypothetical protein